jgi:hypothetical protein
VSGDPEEDFDASVSRFATLGADLQRAFLLRSFFPELVASAATPTTFRRGLRSRLAANDALFPGQPRASRDAPVRRRP